MGNELSLEQLRVVVEAIHRGNKIEAIKYYREATGFGLAESKEAVEAIADSHPPIPTPPFLAQSARSLTPEDRNAVLAAIRRGQKIEAIKIYREATGLGLSESKEAVEAMETRGADLGNGPTLESRTPLPHWDPFAEKRKGCFGLIAVLAGFAAGSVIILWSELTVRL